MRIDLNSDLGESFGIYHLGNDAVVMQSITSANVACGFHGGDPTVIRDTVRMAKARGVAVGAHPGFPDLMGFGRREMKASAREVEDMVLYQVAAVAGIAATEGLRLQHVKAHGALYNQAAADRDLAQAIAAAVAAFDPSLIMFGLPGSHLIDAGRAVGLRVAAEGFADRAYERDGTLASRRKPGSVLHDPAAVLDRVLRMVQDRTVVTVDGSSIPLDVDTICLHGDTPDAAALSAALRAGLERAGVAVRPIGH
jgi:UPF0271 protein